jgi:hypothetical protein
MGTSKNPAIPKKQHKTVSAKTDKSVGAPLKTARGSKRIKPGDGNKPANTRAAYTTMSMEVNKAFKTGVLSSEDLNKAKRVAKTRKKMSTI